MIEQNKGKTIKQIFDENPDGFSINFISMRLETETERGFYVSITNNETTEEELESVFKRVCLVLNNVSCYEFKKMVGGWKFGNKFYLDASLWVRTEEEATTIGKLFNQKGVYDIENKETITI